MRNLSKLVRTCVVLCFCTLVSVHSYGQSPAFDIVLRGGKIVDGTGAPWRIGDVGIVGDHIAAVGQIPTHAGKREIDVTGLIVAPGFIDIHSHSDMLLLEDGAALSKVYQGVTTEVLGEGSSAGPNRGTASTDQSTTGQARFATLRKYFEAVEKSGSAVNVASYVGMDNIWRYVMGNSFDRPNQAQFEEMQLLVDEAMRDGALGLSSMLAMPPGSLAKTEDVIELCKVVAKHGGIYSTHNRHEGTDVVAAVSEAIRIGEQAKLPVDIIHLKIADQTLWGHMQELVELIEAARARGVNVQANVYPYNRGNNNLASIVPPWAHEGGTEKMIERLKDAATRQQIIREVQTGLSGWYNHYTAVGGDWSRMLISGKGPYEGLTMDRILALKGKQTATTEDALSAMLDMLIEQSGSIPTVYEHHTEADMLLALKQPWCSIGSDGSAYATSGELRRGNPHPRNFGTFPRALGVYVRERQVITLEQAVHKMTWLNASKIGIHDRGLLVKDAKADITIFDASRIIDKSTYTDPFHYSEGVEWVIVNGQIVMEQGKPTSARPGKALTKN